MSVHSAEENTFVMTEVTTCVSPPLLTSPVQLMYRYEGDSWLGLNRLNTAGGHEWSDKSPVEFTNWGQGEPNDAWGSESCASVYPNTG